MPQTSATPDSLVFFRVAKTIYYLPFEIKFFASKSEMPTELPQEYMAQVLMQMIHARCRASMLVGAVLLDGVPWYRVWMFEATKAHRQDYMARLERLQTDLAGGPKTWKKRNSNEGACLETLVLGYTDDCVALWEWLSKSLYLLPALLDGNDRFRFPRHY